LVGATIGLLATIAVFAWIAVKANVPKDPEPYRHVQPYEYYLYVPQAYSPDKELPLFIGFHGFGGAIVDCWELWQPYAEKEGFILLCPTLANAEDGWYPETAKSAVWDIIGQIKKEYRIKQKMFIAGYFAGAHFVQEFAYNYPQSVSGASILSAASYDKANLSGKHICFLVVSGDQIDPFSVEQSSLFSQYLAQEGFDVQYKLVPGAGHVITKEGRELTIKLFKKTIEK
jgi:poly(3-hydroxybutyrate) depolymerase